MGPIRVDPDRIQSIAQSCKTSSQLMTEESQRMQSQIASLYDALQGIPNLAIADDFQQLNSTLRQLSSALDQGNTYLTDLVNKVTQFVAALQQR